MTQPTNEEIAVKIFDELIGPGYVSFSYGKPREFAINIVKEALDKKDKEIEALKESFQKLTLERDEELKDCRELSEFRLQGVAKYREKELS